MDYCGPRGIPLSVFLDWPVEDQDAALAWQSLENARCPGCGTRTVDWEPELGGSRTAWTPSIRVCQGCVQLERTRDQHADSKFRGLHIELTRT